MTDQTYWEKHAANYDRSMSLLGKPIPRMLELIVAATTKSRVVLEVAAGTGIVTTAVAPRVERLVATDYAEAMVDRLRQRVAQAGVTNVECARADIYDLRYPDGAFDAVIAANVLHLVPDLEGALAGLRRVLRPGGVLIAPTFCHDQTAASWIVSRALAITGFPGHRRFTSATLSAALKRSGLQVASLETLDGLIPITFAAGEFAQ